MNRRALTIALVFLTMTAVVAWRLHGPKAKLGGAPASEFSAGRAVATLQELLGDERPHPLGSDANRAVRDRVIARFNSLGYDTRLQRAFACNAHATCGTVENIIAAAPAQPTGDEVLLVAHYDSVGAGPGASDDGVGVAALLEIARLIRNERFRNRVVFLIDDGEEAGLLGAEAFVADKRLSGNVGVVINLEARGTSGPSYLFETSRKNRWLIRHASRGLKRPITTSVFPSVYELLPNDTDLTVFKRAGLAGVNFAFINDVVHYHTPLDNLANVNRGTVQHHGESALAMLRELGNADLRARSDDDAIWFDVLGFFVISWPAGLTIPAAIVSFLVLVAGAALLVRRGDAPIATLLLGIPAFLGAVVLAGIGGTLTTWIAGMRAGGARYVANSTSAIVAAWLVGIAAALLAASAAKKRAGFDGLLVGHAVMWHVLAIAVYVMLPGGSYLLLVPAVMLSLAAVWRGVRGRRETTLAVNCFVAAAILFFPFGFALYEALGMPALAGVAIMLALVTTTFTPAAAGRATGILLFVLALLVAAFGAFRPTTTANAPRLLALSYLADAEGRTRWLAGSLTPSLRKMGFDPKPQTISEWGRGNRAYVAPAPRVAITPPEIARVGVDGDVVTLHVRSTRGAPRIALAVKGDAELLRINGVAPPPPPARFRSYLAPGWRRTYVNGSEARVELRVRGPIEAIATDYSSGLPAEGAALANARGANTVPSREGDSTMTVTRVRF